MASSHPGQSHQGPSPSSSYYTQSPIYRNHSAGTYQYPSPFPVQHNHQQPSYHPPQLQQSPRLSGRNGGGDFVRDGHAVPNQNFNPAYSYASAPVPPNRPQPYPPTYANAATLAWQSQQPLSPLPKQLSMPPPVHFEPQLPPTLLQNSDVPTPPRINSPPPPEPSDTSEPDALLSESHSSSRSSSPPPKSSTSQPPASSFLGGWAIWSRRPHDPSHAPGIIISPNARPPPDVIQLALELHTPPPSPPLLPKDIPTPPMALQDDVDKDGIPLVPQTPPHAQSRTSPFSASTATSTVPSSAVTETDSHTLPSSPVTSNTSVGSTPAKGEEVHNISLLSSPVVSTSRSQDSSPSAPTVLLPTEAEAQKPGTLPPVPALVAPPQAPLKKSWASLLQPSSSTSGSSSSSAPIRNAFPTSSVVGFSIPAASPTPVAPVSQTKKKELLALLSPPAGAPLPGTGTGAGVLKIHPRGLVNSGNMCFATSVLQMLVYTPPFHRLFIELGRVLETGKAGKVGRERGRERLGGEEGAPLVDATVEFLREFAVKEDKRNGNVGLPNGAGWGKGKGKMKEKDTEGEEERDEWDGESFLPGYVYDALKGKKRFDNMGGGQQEDAEEFFGFYLDTLEEELLSIMNSLSATPGSTKSAPANKPVEEKLELQEKEEGWLEVGRRNKMVVTRTIKGAETPITRIFGGKFRSTLRASHQKDSVIVEDWRALRLDIQRDHIHTVQDALAHISHPQSVQVTHPSRPGVVLEASQQVLIEALPHILVLHMKRFCYDTSVGGVVKVGKQVRFSPELEIGNDIMAPTKRAQPTRYKLFGVLYHHGHSASGGHYTLDVLHPNRYPSPDPTVKPKESWVRIDDELVSDMRPEDVFGASEKEEESRCAYLLFYRRIR